MAIRGYSSFSKNGKYFACCTVDGKLKIWETSTSTLKQEYIPGQHLSDQLSCISWIVIPTDDAGGEKVLSPSSRKKKRKSDANDNFSDVLALGTTKGSIILYCVASGSAIGKLSDGHSKTVNDLSYSAKRNSLFSCGDDKLLVEWDVNQRAIKRKWKAGSRAIKSVLDLEDGESILAGSSAVQWWDVDNKEILKTFTGHANSISQLKYIPAVKDGRPHFLSSSKEERVVSAWILDYESPEKNSCATFAVMDSPEYLSVGHPTAEDPSTSLAVVTITGVLQCYRHCINGIYPKPIKSILTVTVQDGQNPVPIIGAHIDNDGTILIAYGSSSNVLSFEKLPMNASTSQLNLVRDLKKKQEKEVSISKVKIPEQVDANYLSAVQSGSIPGKNRRKHDDDKQIEAQLPMEERLSNLALLSSRKISGNEKPPMAEHSAQLLLQGLHSKDKSILHSIFMKKECNGIQWIRNTVMRLPVSAVVPLVRELTQLIQKKGNLALAGLNWLHVILVVHGGHLLATGCEELAPLMAIVETRLPLLPHLQRLRGRLDLLLKREGFTDQGISLAEPVQEAALLYCDESSDEESMGNDVRALSSDSDNWDEDSEDDEGDSGSKDSEIDDKDLEDDDDG
ncbi:WD repeat-containing protein 43 [Ischnura elegans]|uniref:WD repeat-containing protein 43 n=1 Tax=Ischnura elegans TaxID=197161 RepID=UPI001ED868E1|nr:WD repeat-containing protein 43 [Ischnura elegans]